MNIYKLSHTINDDYDTFDSCIVIAENEEEAIKIHPNGWQNWDTRGKAIGKLKREKAFWQKVLSVLWTKTGIIDREYVDKQLSEIEAKIKEVEP